MARVRFDWSRTLAILLIHLSRYPTVWLIAVLSIDPPSQSLNDIQCIFRQGIRVMKLIEVWGRWCGTFTNPD